MNKSDELIKKVLKDNKYKIQEVDDEHFIIRYQLNTIHICPSAEDDHFVSIMLANFAEVTEENFKDVVMRCHKLNECLKLVKLYTINDVIIASAEFFYMGKKDLTSQIKIGLDSVIAAKVKYQQMDK